MKITLETINKLVFTSKDLFKNGTPTFKTIYEACLTEPKNIAATYLDDEGKWRSYNYKTYQEYSVRFARQLTGLLSQYPQNSVIGLKMKNSHIWPYLFWGILASGHTPLLLDFRLEVDKANVLLKEAHAVALIAADESEYIVPLYHLADIYKAQKVEPSTWADEIILCTSGTTGNSKMMIYHGENMAYQIYSAIKIPETTFDLMGPQQINNLAMIPFHHIFGLVAVLFWFTFYHKNLVYPASTASRDILDAVKNGKCTHIFSVPMLFDSIASLVTRSFASKSPKLQANFEKMCAYNRGEISKKEAGFAGTKFFNKLVKKKIVGTAPVYLISGGGYLKEDTNRLINGIGYPLYNGFGMTEIGVSSVEISPDVKDRLKGSIGKALTGIEYKIDTNGELLIKSKIIHEEEIIGGVRKKTELEDGFFRSGDIAEMDKDGRVYIKGRLKEVIINSDGENIYPDELESHFQTLPHLLRLSIAGVPRGDKQEEIALIIEPEPGLDKEKSLELKKAFEELNEKLNPSRRVQKVYLATKPMPLANGIKIKRLAVAKAIANKEDGYIDLYGEEKKSLSREERFKGFDPKEVNEVLLKIKKVFASTLLLSEEGIGDDSNFGTDLGGDSMSYVSMVYDINTAFDMDLPENLYGTLLTPSDFAEYILNNKKGS